MRAGGPAATAVEDKAVALPHLLLLLGGLIVAVRFLLLLVTIRLLGGLVVVIVLRPANMHNKL
jgi:hypothetical protein